MLRCAAHPSDVRVGVRAPGRAGTHALPGPAALRRRRGAGPGRRQRDGGDHATAAGGGPHAVGAGAGHAADEPGLGPGCGAAHERALPDARDAGVPGGEAVGRARRPRRRPDALRGSGALTSAAARVAEARRHDEGPAPAGAGPSDRAPKGIRTPDLLFRRQTLYPAELWAHHPIRRSGSNS
ncbi:hypothetical protein MICRO80W_20085 [Micrococcus luteus]|nr:hypothetical protein MICRO80W_20085 [Micrococcus luteus]